MVLDTGDDLERRTRSIRPGQKANRKYVYLEGIGAALCFLFALSLLFLRVEEETKEKEVWLL